MRQLYVKPDLRKPWQKSMVLAIAIFCLLAVWDFIFTLVWYISYPIGKIIYPFTGAPKSRRYPGAFKMPDGPMVDNSHS